MRLPSISVMLVDDHAIVRQGYLRLLEKQQGMVVVAEAADAASAYQAYKKLRPDVVVMDLSMPGRGGIDAIRQIRQWDPTARVLVFTMHFELGIRSPGLSGRAQRALSPRAARPSCSLLRYVMWLPAGSPFVRKSAMPLP